ncbi:3'-5' exoribonuclease YhaM family protein [Limnochorda pilosa]|uniref:HD domain-containing protein n=1 Tax=Limnochorda pilosa TaxID=1555112 RepID=A0A0K2SIB6_LIMPI|nr:HD domain-containing protein [Limnochorda pilosa]BAS26584.1 hypothetical protein LIP_0727 [Limnochorda pilosa]
MFKRRFIEDLRPGERLADFFVASDKELARTQNGKAFLRLHLSDRTGRLPAVAWDDAESLWKSFDDGSVVKVETELGTYRGQEQFTVFRLRRATPEEIEEEAYLPSSRRPLGEMEAELQEVVSGVRDPWLQALLARFFSPGSEGLRRYVRHTAATGVHHAYVGGLLEHVLEMVRIARTLCSLHPEYVNEDLVVAAVLLHDVGKLEEYAMDGMAFRQTDLGRLYGHLYQGARWVEQEAAAIDGFPEPLAQELIHCILSHHGLQEHGAVVVPQTLNAQVLHYADLVSARLNQFRQLIEGKGRQATLETWSEFDRFLGVRAFRGFLEPPAGAQHSPEGSPDALPGAGPEAMGATGR